MTIHWKFSRDHVKSTEYKQWIQADSLASLMAFALGASGCVWTDMEFFQSSVALRGIMVTNKVC
jgi:hypothetical protein